MSAEEIYAVYAQGAAATTVLVQSLIERINRVEERLETLENQNSKNSGNSSKPPSGDGFVKRTRSLRHRSERSSGGQRSHPGSTLSWREDVSEVVEHRVHQCRGCGERLSHAPAMGTVVHQVHDLPEIKLEVIEHRAEVK